MNESNIPINKGNYSMDTPERESHFKRCLAEGWELQYHEYRRQWSELPKAQKVSEYPLLVDIELSSICNLKCPMCYTISKEFKKVVNTTMIDFDLYTKIIDEISEKVPAIRLSLRGEATLHSKFIECIAYAKERGVKEVSTLTNGSRLNLPYFEKMVRAGIDWITISVDGTGDVYERIRKPIKFKEILEYIRDIAAYKKERGLHRPVVKVQGVWPAIQGNPQAYYDTFAPYADLVAFNPLIDYRFRDENIVYENDFCCPQQYQRLVIGADGLVMKCSNDEEGQDLVGDVNKQSIHEIWHGEKMQAIREMMKQPNGFMQSKVCRQCYLPRKTENTEAQVGGRTFIVRNYVHRSQLIGE